MTQPNDTNSLHTVIWFQVFQAIIWFQDGEARTNT